LVTTPDQKRGATFLKEVLGEAVTQLIQGKAHVLPILNRFSAVYVQDSSVVDLPEDFREVWPGNGNGAAHCGETPIHYSWDRHDRISACAGIKVTSDFTEPQVFF